MVGITISTEMRYQPTLSLCGGEVGKYHIHFCSNCFDIKNVVVASSDADIYSVVQGDIKTTNRLCQKKKKKYN